MKWKDTGGRIVAEARLGPLFVQIWDYSNDDPGDLDAEARYRVFICADDEDKCHERALVGEDSYGKAGSYPSIEAAKIGARDEAARMIESMANDLVAGTSAIAVLSIK